jgi:hypothetical protein
LLIALRLKDTSLKFANLLLLFFQITSEKIKDIVGIYNLQIKAIMIAQPLFGYKDENLWACYK